MPVDVEDAVVGWRKQLEADGLDHGATTIQWHLGRDETFTGEGAVGGDVHRILVRRGFVVAQPAEASEVVVATVRSAGPERVVADRLHGLGDRHAPGW